MTATQPHPQLATMTALLYLRPMNQLGRKGYRIPFSSFLSSVLLVGLLCAGCRTPHCSEESFARAFDAQRVAQLSHDSYKVAWEARSRARQDLRTISRNTIVLDSNPRAGGLAGRATVLDWEAVYYINRLLHQAPWIARDVEKNPATPRCSSRVSYNIVAFDATMLKARYNAGSFEPYTARLIEKLTEMTDEISSYYRLKTSDRTSPSNNENVPK